MIIINQRRDTIINLDRMDTIRLVSQYIQGDVGSKTITLATYETSEKAAQVFNDLICNAGDIYLLPEE